MEVDSLSKKHRAGGVLDPDTVRRNFSGGMPYSAPVSPKSVGRRGVRATSITADSVLFSEERNRNSAHKARSLTPSVKLLTTPSNLRTRTFHPDASLVLVGIRGCGKRSLGFIAATALGRRFVTEDHFFQSTTGLSRQDYLKVHGSQEFHKRDIEVSRKMLDDNKFKCVIECGLGSLTSSVQDHLKEYSLTHPVVYLVRDMTEIKRLLRLTDSSARWLENGDPTHRRCSNFEFYNLEDYTTEGEGLSDGDSLDRRSPSYSFKLKETKEDFSYFVRFITGASRYRPSYDSPFSLSEVPVDQRLYTHALEVRSSAYQDKKIDLAQLESGGDVVEIFVDQWSNAAINNLSKMVAETRRKIGVPIILSATRGQPTIDNDTYISILEQGLRLGVEFLSVDLDLDDRQITSFVASKGFTRIIGHFSDSVTSKCTWEDEDWIKRYNRAEMLGCDMVRLLRFASSRDDNETLRRFTDKIRTRAQTAGCPSLIAYNIGPLGRTSQVFNPILTSVTHPALKDIAKAEDSGLGPQISSRQAVQALLSSFVLDPLNFYILGADVSYSLSPAMHNASYDLLGMSHTYKTKNITSLADLNALAQDPHFGGAAIVQPWKVALVGQLASKSRHAEAIGAVNTMVPLRAETDGSIPPLPVQARNRNRAGRVVGWYGDNTDWIGIRTCLNRSISPRNVIVPMKTTGLVIGAGGMARAAVYAMLNLGCRNVFIYNRTPSHAEALAAHFNRWAAAASAVIATTGSVNGNGTPEPTVEVVRVLRSTDDTWPAGFAMPTMAVSCVTQENLNQPGKTAANFEMPAQWLGSASGGVIVEMSYSTPDTPLMRQIKRIRESTGVPWVLVDGLEVLPEQALAQFEIMTGRKAPRGRMKEEILKIFHERQKQRQGGGM